MAHHLKNIDAATAARLKEEGALMVDVRESGEFASVRIPGSENVALSRFEGADLPLAQDQAVVFYCASGGRTNMHAARLAAKAGKADAYVMAGGISAWSRAGLPVESGGRTQEQDTGSRGGFLSRFFQR